MDGCLRSKGIRFLEAAPQDAALSLPRRLLLRDEEERYGSRLAEVRPTPASEVYLYGDKLSAPQTVDALNAGLRRE